ncbi:hypothetical protein DPMN_022697 [Dreissena polymorpha]|uniref:Uncharacterized protein n=1 Tax=Dreissena polymorpha TaxID=45954 RepID=A0A9D4NPQ3_DREPO|nr:hypothetical protein DPMN_022697 [Dreissena polymorpha]
MQEANFLSEIDELGTIVSLSKPGMLAQCASQVPGVAVPPDDVISGINGADWSRL